LQKSLLKRKNKHTQKTDKNISVCQKHNKHNIWWSDSRFSSSRS